MKKVVLMIVLAIAAMACTKSQSPENAAREIVDCMNKNDYSTIWDKYLAEADKTAVAKSVEDIKKDPSSVLLLQPLGIDNANIQTITPKEMYIKMTEFFNSLLKDQIKDNVTIKNVEVKGDEATIFTTQGSFEGKLNLTKIKGKWYLFNKQEEPAMKQEEPAMKQEEPMMKQDEPKAKTEEPAAKPK